MAKAVFLDRDGTINFDPGYLNSPDELRIFSNAAEALKILKDHNYLLLVVTNQSGIGRGFMELKDVHFIHQRMNKILEHQAHVQIDEFLVCPHHPQEGCECRKPNIKLIEDAFKNFNIDPKQSFLIGDKITDLQAGRNAGLKGNVLVRTGAGKKTETDLEPGSADFVANDILEGVHWIIGQTG